MGWESGCNNGDQCKLGRNRKHNALAVEWCKELSQKFPELAALGEQLLVKKRFDLSDYLYSFDAEGLDSEKEWERRAVAAWYAMLRYGIEHGDTLEYW